MSRLVISNNPISNEDRVWLSGLKLDDDYFKLSFKFYNEAHTQVLGAAIISTPYPNFARVDGLYAVTPDSLREFLRLLTTTYKQDILAQYSREVIKTLNPRLSIKKQPGFDILTSLNYQLGEGLFGDQGEWYVYSVWSDLLAEPISLVAT